MEFLILWAETSIACFCMEVVNELRMFKDVADAGYKINIERISELENEINPNATTEKFIKVLIPMFNLMQLFQNVIQYNNIRSILLDQLNAINALEEMSEIEKEEYLKKPTALNAIIVPLKLDKRLSRAQSIKIDDEQSEIFYEIGDSIYDITILKVIGPASRLTVEQQKEKIIESYNINNELNIEKYDEEILVNSLNEEIDKENITQFVQDLNISEQKQLLEDYKKELLRENQDAKNTKTDNRQKTKKK